MILNHKPRSEPKFHNVLTFEGKGKSINALLTVFNNGCWIRIGLFINFETDMHSTLIMII